MPYKFTFMFILQNLGRLSGKNTQYSRKKRKYYRHRLKQNQLFLNPAYFIEAISDSFTQIPITYLRGKEEFWGGAFWPIPYIPKIIRNLSNYTDPGPSRVI